MNEPTLFDQVIIAQRKVSPTMVDSFHTKKVQEKRLTQKEKILNAVIKRCGTANDRIMSELSGVPRYLVPDRRAQLVKENKLRSLGMFEDPVTKVMTEFYEVVR